VPGTPAAGTIFALGSTNPFAEASRRQARLGVVNFQRWDAVVRTMMGSAQSRVCSLGRAFSFPAQRSATWVIFASTA